MRSHWTKKLALLVFGLVLGLGLGEILARLFVLAPTESAIPREIGQYDPELGWSLRPSTSCISRGTGVPIDYAINSDGLRDVEASLEKTPGTTRIAVFGDSFTFGLGIPTGKSYCDLLEGYFPNVEVLNFGVSGFGVDQMLLRYRHHGRRYAPDLVLVYVPYYSHHRHMHGRRFGKLKPRFRLEEDRLALQGQPVPREGEWAKPGPLRALARWVHARSRLAQILRRMQIGLGSREDAETVWSADRADRDDEEFMEAMHGLAFAIVSEFRKEAEADGARFLLVSGIGRLHSDAVAGGIPSLDVRVPLDNRKMLLSEDSSHFNASGNAVLAWVISKHLREIGFVPTREGE